jgi:hypothetical protein
MEPKKNLQNKQIPSPVIVKNNETKPVRQIVQSELRLDSRDWIPERGQK